LLFAGGKGEWGSEARKCSANLADTERNERQAFKRQQFSAAKSEMAYHNHFMLNSLGVNPKSAMPSFPLSFPFRAEETADRDMQLDGSAEARQVGESTSVSAMDATGIKGAERASGRQWVVARTTVRLLSSSTDWSRRLPAGALSKSSEIKPNPRNTTQLDESDQVIPYVRRPIIESAGEPRNKVIFDH
jgi:hypothetical protein